MSLPFNGTVSNPAGAFSVTESDPRGAAVLGFGGNAITGSAGGVGVQGTGGNSAVSGEAAGPGLSGGGGSGGPIGGAGLQAAGGQGGDSATSAGGPGALLIGGGGNGTGGAGLRVASGINAAGVRGNAVEAYGNAMSNAAGYWVNPPPSSVPSGQMLQHAYVGSSEMKNIYDGIAVLDDSGQVIVQVPDYIAQLNGNFRYQLTPMGASMPNLYLADELMANTFRIAGGAPSGKVSWQITGVRQDSWATTNPVSAVAPVRNGPAEF